MFPGIVTGSVRFTEQRGGSVTKAILGLFGVSLLASVAQTPAGPEVTKSLVCDQSSACTRGYLDGRKYETMASEKVGVVVVGDVVGKYLRAEVFVTNEGAKPVDVLPSNFVLVETAPTQKPLKYVDPDKLVRSAARSLAWGNAFAAMGGSMARQQVTTTTSSVGTISTTTPGAPMTMGTYNGTSSSTTSAPDYAARARAAQTIATRNEAFSSLASNAERMILRANTVLPGQSVLGVMLFERDKKARTVMLSCIVGNTIYQFPFDLTTP
jgi:hypothetical protein